MDVWEEEVYKALSKKVDDLVESKVDETFDKKFNDHRAKLDKEIGETLETRTKSINKRIDDIERARAPESKEVKALKQKISHLEKQVNDTHADKIRDNIAQCELVIDDADNYKVHKNNPRRQLSEAVNYLRAALNQKGNTFPIDEVMFQRAYVTYGSKDMPKQRLWVICRSNDLRQKIYQNIIDLKLTSVVKKGQTVAERKQREVTRKQWNICDEKNKAIAKESDVSNTVPKFWWAVGIAQGIPKARKFDQAHPKAQKQATKYGFA